MAGGINRCSMNFKALLFHVLGKAIKMLMALRSYLPQILFCIDTDLSKEGLQSIGVQRSQILPQPRGLIAPAGEESCA